MNDGTMSIKEMWFWFSGKPAYLFNISRPGALPTLKLGNEAEVDKHANPASTSKNINRYDKPPLFLKELR